MSFDLKISGGDLVIGFNGDVQKIQDTDKLIQDLLKISTTPLNSNPFFPGYGSTISKSLIGSAFDTEFVSTMASNQLKNSIEILQKLQKDQATSQNVTGLEQIAAIKEVKIERTLTDPRFFTVSIKVLNKALNSVGTEFQTDGL